ncbi:MAG: hypothetical protein ABIW82_15010 [Dokdonella sp.]
MTDLGSQGAKITSLLMRAFDLNVGSVRTSVTHCIPVIERKLFDREDPAFSQKLLGVLEELDGLGCRWVAFELLNGQRYVSGSKNYQITSDRIRKMIKSREESLEEQRRLGELEDDTN